MRRQFLLFILLGQATPDPPANEAELAVLESVAGSHLSTSYSKCQLARLTFPRPHRWSAARQLTRSGESPTPMTIPEELITAFRLANTTAASLEALRIGKGLTWQLSGESTADCTIRLSRPGISADGNRALVDIWIETPPRACPNGHFVYLEKRERAWAIVADGAYWLTECVCVPKSGEPRREPALPAEHVHQDRGG
jgi:hypothetical protein